MISGSTRCEWLGSNELLLKPLRLVSTTSALKETHLFYVVVFISYWFNYFADSHKYVAKMSRT